jgi:hypothetical protein
MTIEDYPLNGHLDRRESPLRVSEKQSLKIESRFDKVWATR